MNVIAYRILEIAVFAIFLFCLRDAWRKGKETKPRSYSAFWVMIVAMFFTFTFESLLTGKPDAIYTYPEQPGVLVQIQRVPLWIPCGWAFIFHVVMQTSDALGLPWKKRAAMDAMLALMIDFALDPVAQLSSWWNWDMTKAKDVVQYTTYFDIPLTNFMAWVVIIGSFSFLVRWGQRKWIQPGSKWWFGDLIVPALAIIPAVVVVIAYTQIGRWFMGQTTWYTNGAVVCPLIWGLIVCWLAKDLPRFRRDRAWDRVVVLSPAAFFGLLVLCVYATREFVGGKLGDFLFRSHPELTLFVPLVALFSMLIFVWPYLGKRGHNT